MRQLNKAKLEKLIAKLDAGKGDVSLNFGAVLSFLTVKTVTEQILLVYKDNKIKIGTLTLPAKCTSLPAWLA